MQRSRILDRLLDLLYPPRCVFCREIIERENGGICPDCREKLALLDNDLTMSGEFFERGAACLPYSGSVRESIHRFKFGGRKEYAGTYAQLLCNRVRDDGDICSCDIVTSPPTNRRNIRKRGYDHAGLLAERAAGLMGIGYVRCFEKSRETKAMFGLHPAERRSNIMGAIALAVPSEQIAEKNVLIIDDIFTTGATMSECARVLKMGGAKKVFVLTVAKTEK